ncbi:MAG TPA: hypothetical protein VHZ31_02145 [Solirubrobacteraceae bacterium]|jgi:hypothetical protein|nr:hypothetical protein [Solirubrobacteraceae bacterium]
MSPGARVAAFVALLAAIFAGAAVAGGAVGPAHHDDPGPAHHTTAPSGGMTTTR